MEKKRQYAVISAVVLSCVIGLIIFKIMNNPPLKGLFYAVKGNNFRVLDTVDGLSISRGDGIDPGLDDTNSEYAGFDQDYLEDGLNLALTFYDDEIIINGKYYPDQQMVFIMISVYYVKTNQLIHTPLKIYNYERKGAEIVKEEEVRNYMREYGLTEDDIREMQHYLIYDVIMQSWVSRGGRNRKLDPSAYKNLKIEDHTFDFEE